MTHLLKYPARGREQVEFLRERVILLAFPHIIFASLRDAAGQGLCSEALAELGLGTLPARCREVPPKGLAQLHRFMCM